MLMVVISHTRLFWVPDRQSSRLGVRKAESYNRVSQQRPAVFEGGVALEKASAWLTPGDITVQMMEFPIANEAIVVRSTVIEANVSKNHVGLLFDRDATNVR